MTQADPYAPHMLFGFPMWASLISGSEQHKEGLLKHVMDLRERYPGVVRSNRHAWHSGPEFIRHKSEHVAWLLQKVTKFATLATARYHDNWQHHELVLAGCWANVLGFGGWNAPHHHAPTHWSGAYYVNVGTLPTEPGDFSGMIEFLNPNPQMALYGQSGNYVHRPKDGLMVLFPASVTHYVHPRFAEDLRVSIAYNFTVVPRAEKADGKAATGGYSAQLP